MKFDVVVGNPPYHQSKENTRDNPIYNYFYDLSEKIGGKYCLISPARFLFNAGSTNKSWNKKMLSDKHIKVEFYEQDSSKLFPNTDIKGGVAILYRDNSKNFRAIGDEIGTFTVFEELSSIVRKVTNLTIDTLDTIISAQGIYKFTTKIYKDYPDLRSKLSTNTVGTGVFSTLNNIVFFVNKPNDGYEYIAILGRYENKRVIRYIRKDYINEPYGFDKWKVILPKANGSGSLGEVLSSPTVGKPLLGFTQTFISIGAFNTQIEAENALKYLKSKFARTMLGILKITQDNLKDKWKKVPIQSFISPSDIDWDKDITEIDKQLYLKYNLDENEINFIESNVKEMN
ncbi:MAG: DNA/RNA helicase [Neisseriaceae bacterium]|nr:MAG: DNA/RNA helicase [Neisseriaceae bacterium]